MATHKMFRASLWGKSCRDGEARKDEAAVILCI